jgi:hypothetical protein
MAIYLSVYARLCVCRLRIVYRSGGLSVSAIETACLWWSGVDRGKSVGLCGLHGLPQTATDIGDFPDELAVGSSAKTFDRFFGHLIRLPQDRLQLNTLKATAS